MIDPAEIMEDMEVVGSDGEHVGTVDHMEGLDRIKLSKDDPASGGEHHIIPLDLVEGINEDCVVLRKPAADVMRTWQATV